MLFAENLHDNVLLEHTHRHVIFSLPKRLRIYFKFDRSLFQLLYRAAWETWNEYVHEQLSGSIIKTIGMTGAVMALHSSGDLLHWHPHIHTIALNGTLLDDGNFCELTEVADVVLQQRFAEKVFAALLRRELITQDTIDSMNTWQHSGFNVYAGKPIQADDENARLFLAHYLKKAPLSVSRLQIDDSGLDPVVQYSKTTDDGQTFTREFSPLEFLAELSLHIPKTWEQTSRSYGIYSSSTRGKINREKRYQVLIQNNFKPLDQEPEKQPASASFARCMKMVFEIDPLRCCRCGESMKIVAFIFDSQEIEKIASNLGRTTWRAPPAFTPTGMRLDTSYPFAQSR